MQVYDYRTLKAALDSGCEMGTTEDGEATVFRYGGEGVVIQDIYQTNGWICSLHYHEDGRVEEMYSRQ